MDTNDNKFERATIIIGIIQIVLAFIQTFITYNTILLISTTTLSAILILVLIIYRSKYIKFLYNYKLIQYLFHNRGRNRFNSLPKMLLLQNQKGKYNEVKINKLKIVWKMHRHEDYIDSIFEWELNGITNIGKRNISEYLMYNTYDIAKSSKANLSFFLDGQKIDYDLTFEESNKVRILTFGLSEILRPKKRIEKLKIVLKSKDSVKIGRNDALCIYPINYGKKVESIDIDISLDFSSKFYDFDMIEIGRIPGNKGISERNLKRGIPMKQDNKIRYKFSLDEDILKMKNIYVVLLSAKNPENI